MIFALDDTDGKISSLTQWKIIRAIVPKIGYETYHFVGMVEGFGRVSSPIVEFDTVAKTGSTRSGRTYHLSGPSTKLPDDAEYVMRHWEDVNGTTAEDVTDVYLKEHR